MNNLHKTSEKKPDKITPTHSYFFPIYNILPRTNAYNALFPPLKLCSTLVSFFFLKEIYHLLTFFPTDIFIQLNEQMPNSNGTKMNWYLTAKKKLQEFLVIILPAAAVAAFLFAYFCKWNIFCPPNWQTKSNRKK